MKKIVFFILGWLIVFSINAQEKLWTLEECIQYAIDHNITIKQIELQKENAEIDLNTSKMSRLPDLNAGVGQEWSFDHISETKNVSSSSLSVSSSIPLFTGFRISNEIEKNKLELKAATESLAKAKENLSLSIASLFLQVLFDKEILKVNEEQLQLSQIQVDRTKALIDVGKVPLSQLYDIEAQVAKDELSVIQAKNNWELSLLDLAQSLELEKEVHFNVYAPDFTDVVGEFMSSVQPPQVIYNNAVNIKPHIKEQEYKVGSAEKTLKIAESGYMPTLNLSMGYGTGYYYNYGLDGTDFSNIPFSEQLKNNGSEYIGLRLSIPIFNRFAVRNQVRGAKINISNQQLALDNVKKALYKEIQTAYLNATAAQEKYRVSGKAVRAAQESFNYTEEKYEVGKSSVFEFNEAKTKLVQTQSEEIQAKYDYIFRTKILDFYNGIRISL